MTFGWGHVIFWIYLEGTHGNCSLELSPSNPNARTYFDWISWWPSRCTEKLTLKIDRVVDSCKSTLDGSPFTRSTNTDTFIPWHSQTSSSDLYGSLKLLHMRWFKVLYDRTLDSLRHWSHMYRVLSTIQSLSIYWFLLQTVIELHNSFVPKHPLASCRIHCWRCYGGINSDSTSFQLFTFLGLIRSSVWESKISCEFSLSVEICDVALLFIHKFSFWILIAFIFILILVFLHFFVSFFL